MATLNEILAALAARKHPVQLVKNEDDLSNAERARMTWPAIATVKEDGVYAAVCWPRDQAYPTFISRTGNVFYIAKELGLKLCFNAGLCRGEVFITELCNNLVSLEVLSGLVNTNRKTPWSDDELVLMWNGARLMVRDVLTVDEFMQGRSNVPYGLRLATVRSMCKAANVIRATVLHTQESWEGYAQDWIDADEEGAVLHQLNAPWVAGPKSEVSVKRVRGVDVDLRCTGWSLGKGKRSAQVAKLHFEYQGKPFSADLGKGWTDAKRDELTARAQGINDDVTGSIFHIHGLQVSSKGVIRLPKVCEERIDKVEAD